MSRSNSYTSANTANGSRSSGSSYSSFSYPDSGMDTTSSASSADGMVSLKSSNRRGKSILTDQYDYKPNSSRPASLKTTATSSTSSSVDTFLNSGQTYSAYLQEQAHAQAQARAQAQAKKNVNVYTTCGRHSNEWLFSGWSFRR